MTFCIIRATFDVILGTFDVIFKCHLTILKFGNQVIVSAMKFRKWFSKFMIPIALLEKCGCYLFILRTEVGNIIAESSKPNKLRNVYTVRSKRGTSPSKNRKIYYIKINVIALIINFILKEALITI